MATSYTYEFTPAYDYDSIMHYDSQAFRDKTKSQDLLNMSLVKWKQGGPNYTPPAKPDAGNAEWMDLNMKPSAGDVAMIKAMYPYFISTS
jgi:hypothetical protein